MDSIVCCVLHVGSLLGLLLRTEDAGDMSSEMSVGFVTEDRIQARASQIYGACHIPSCDHNDTRGYRHEAAVATYHLRQYVKMGANRLLLLKHLRGPIRTHIVADPGPH
jgi:hypothetical protein